MRWKRISNLILVVILSIAYTIVTLLNIIGPLHMNETGQMNELGMLAFLSILYWIFSLIITWGVYFYLKKKAEILFFTLIILGIGIIIIENFLWAWMGSQ